MMPAQALMLGAAIAPLLLLGRRARMKGLPGAIALIQTIIALAAAIALVFLARSVQSLTVTPILFASMAIVFSILSARDVFAVRPARWLIDQSLAYAFVLLGFGVGYLTPLNNTRSPAAVAREVAALADGQHTAILQSRLPEEVSFYFPLHPQTGPAPSIYLVIVDDHVEVERRARAKRPIPIPEPDEELFQSWFPTEKVISIRRLELKSAPGDARWKAYAIMIHRTAYAMTKSLNLCENHAAPVFTSCFASRNSALRSSSVPT